jgi:hypothetical protein
MVRKLLIAACAALLPASAFAVYNANNDFVVVGVATYTETDSIYISVSAPPAHSGCNNAFFVISGGISADRRKAMLAQLLMAKATGQAINFGYDGTGDCSEGYIRVHRIG